MTTFGPFEPTEPVELPERSLCCLSWGQWSEWKCDDVCGKFQGYRTRNCEFGIPEVECPPETEFDPIRCRLARAKIPVAAVSSELFCDLWSVWSEWQCGVTCGRGDLTRERVCDRAQDPLCQGFVEQDIEKCELEPCKEDCCLRWSVWSAWSPCDRTCGDGKSGRIRECQLAQSEECVLEEEITPCEDEPCPCCTIWTAWSEWSPCDRTCGDGNSGRIRGCENPQSEECVLEEETTPCEDEPCPCCTIWSVWSEWSPCDRTCGEGKSGRIRNCENPQSKGCEQDVEITPCEDEPCPCCTIWSVWSEWSPCDRTCGNGKTGRIRNCENPQGDECEEDVETIPCENEPCDCCHLWSEWTEWTCQCWDGQGQRERECLFSPEGEKCPTEYDYEMCEAAIDFCDAGTVLQLNPE